MHAAARSIVFKPMEGTLQTVILELAQAELDASVWAAVYRTAHISPLISPKDKLLSHASYTDRLILHFFGFQHDIPLVSDHKSL
jgi:hypothetical protein